jgi:hypothetical protein
MFKYEIINTYIMRLKTMIYVANISCFINKTGEIMKKVKKAYFEDIRGWSQNC